MNFGARRWWIVGGLRGALPDEYHYLAGNMSACGKGPVVGRFFRTADTPAMQRRKRCPACVEARAKVARDLETIRHLRKMGLPVPVKLQEVEANEQA